MVSELPYDPSSDTSAFAPVAPLISEEHKRTAKFLLVDVKRFFGDRKLIPAQMKQLLEADILGSVFASATVIEVSHNNRVGSEYAASEILGDPISGIAYDVQITRPQGKWVVTFYKIPKARNS